MWDWQPPACWLAGSLLLAFLEIHFKQSKQLETDLKQFPARGKYHSYYDIVAPAVSAPHGILSDRWEEVKKKKKNSYKREDSELMLGEELHSLEMLDRTLTPYLSVIQDFSYCVLSRCQPVLSWFCDLRSCQMLTDNHFYTESLIESKNSGCQTNNEGLLTILKHVRSADRLRHISPFILECTWGITFHRYQRDNFSFASSSTIRIIIFWRLYGFFQSAHVSLSIEMSKWNALNHAEVLWVMLKCFESCWNDTVKQ